MLGVVGAGCGSSGKSPHASGSASSERGATGATRPAESGQRANFASIGVLSSAKLPSGRLSPKYTCKGQNVSPPLLWSDVGPGTKEVVAVVRTLTRGQITTDWIVGGISPNVHRITEGSVPPGAVVGRNSAGQASYSLCPPTDKPALVVMGIYALPQKLSLQTGFNQNEVNRVVLNPGVSWGSTTALAGAGGAALRG
jgi:phosphatidylethanolamine-binding protein (PEBP) family uncharacterized protein